MSAYSFRAIRTTERIAYKIRFVIVDTNRISSNCNVSARLYKRDINVRAQVDPQDYFWADACDPERNRSSEERRCARTRMCIFSVQQIEKKIQINK